jgi:hypothetical protein
MKKNILSLAVASSVAGLAVTAQASMYLNPEGTGEVLLFPYYNAQNENQTSMSIVNTSDDAKAVKVRFMEYVNSQEVLDFNLYLSAKDHFAFTIYQVGDGAGIVTTDNSCTVPELGTGSGTYAGSKEELPDGATKRIQPFVPYQYASGATPDLYIDDSRNMVGHVEVIEMGVLSDDGTTLATSFDPASYATHGSNGVPANCAALVAAWSTGGAWLAEGALQRNVGAPTGGLYGVSNMLNNTDAAAYGVEASAIADFWAGTTTGHAVPGSTDPSLTDGDVKSLIPNKGAFYEVTFTDAIDAVSSLFMATSISNDVMAAPGLAGETDWVVTFPTRRYYVNELLAANRLPFTDRYQGSNSTAGGPASSCETVTINQVDREESQTDPTIDGPIFSPPPPDPVAGDPNQLCYETNTIAVNGVSALNAGVSTDTVLDAAISVGWGQDQPEGWQTISFTDANVMTAASTPTGANGATINGLPVLGFAAFEYTNGAKNFGFVSDHKTTVAGSALEPAS